MRTSLLPTQTLSRRFGRRGRPCLHHALTGCGDRLGRCLECRAVMPIPFNLHAL